MKNIAVIVGSLRKESYNRKVALELQRLAPSDLKLNIVEIGNLPLYNPDLEENTPQEWLRFREHIKDADGVVFVSPEYNRTMPAAVKNALDVGSRPPAENVWKEKPGAIITASPGAIGGFGANHDIRQASVPVGIRIMSQPEMYLGGINKAFLEDGHTLSDEVAKLLHKFLESYRAWLQYFKS